MVEVRLTANAQADFQSLPVTVRVRAQEVFNRLTRWPAVSGAKPLRGEMAGTFRIRTGDWRVLFRVERQAGQVVIFRIAHRRDVYE